MHGAAWSAALIRITRLAADNLLHHPGFIAALGKVFAGPASKFPAEHAPLIQAVRLCPDDVKAALLADGEGAAPHATALMMPLVASSSALQAALPSLISAEPDLEILGRILRAAKGAKRLFRWSARRKGSWTYVISLPPRGGGCEGAGFPSGKCPPAGYGGKRRISSYP